MHTQEYFKTLEALPLVEVKRLLEIDKEDRDNTKSIVRYNELNARISATQKFIDDNSIKI